MTKLILYPAVKVKGLSFKGQKRLVIPNQSMTLQEIIKRFTRRESLPIEHQGQYETRFGDLEKLKHEDITVRMERAEELRTWREAGEKRLHDAQAQEAQKKLDELVKQEVDKLQSQKPPTEVKTA